jgi:hypothetical protein
MLGYETISQYIHCSYYRRQVTQERAGFSGTENAAEGKKLYFRISHCLPTIQMREGSLQTSLDPTIGKRPER